MTREEASKRFEVLLSHVDTDCVMGMETTEAIKMAIKALEQPEIIRCKECKHWEYDVIFADGWCRGKQQGNPEWFCADAERRPDETD